MEYDICRQIRLCHIHSPFLIDASWSAGKTAQAFVRIALSKSQHHLKGVLLIMDGDFKSLMDFIKRKVMRV